MKSNLDSALFERDLRCFSLALKAQKKIPSWRALQYTVRKSRVGGLSTLLEKPEWAGSTLLENPELAGSTLLENDGLNSVINYT